MLSYVERGKGRALLLIPGLEGAKEFWRPQLEALSARYRVIACDLPVLQPSLHRRMAHYARPILELMDALGVGSAVVMGASLGGLVALEVALRVQARVDGLVLASALDRPSFGTFGLNMFTLATAATAAALVPGFPRQHAKRVFRWAAKHGGFFLDSAPNAEELMDYALHHGIAAGPAALADRLIAAAKAWYVERARGIKAPVLLLRGEEDRLVSATSFDALVARMPHAETVTLRGAGHSCTLSAADEANRVILEWLESVHTTRRRRERPE